MAEIIEEELFSDPLSKAGSTGSLTTACSKKLAVSPVGITFGQRRPYQHVQARDGGTQACLAHVLQGF